MQTRHTADTPRALKGLLAGLAMVLLLSTPLALLFLVHEVAVNWPELTGGDRGGLSFLPGTNPDTRTPIYVALILSIVVARLFAASNTGRRAQAAQHTG